MVFDGCLGKEYVSLIVKCQEKHAYTLFSSEHYVAMSDRLRNLVFGLKEKKFATVVRIWTTNLFLLE